MPSVTKTTNRPTSKPKKNTQQSERFFDLSLDMLCIAGSDGYFQRLNPAFKTVLGHEIEDLLKTPFLDFVHPEDMESTLAELEWLKKGRPAINFQNRYRCKDGTYKWLSWYSMPQPDGHLYAVARDITKVKEEEKKMKRIIEDLKRSNEELEHFAYIASHDLQEPLRKITNFSGLLVEKYNEKLDDTAKKYMDYMVDGAKRMSQLIDDLLMYSRVGREKVALEEIDIADLVQKITDDFRDTITAINGTFEFENLPKITFYKTQLVQLFSNLINNAIKFHSKAPLKVSITAEKVDGYYHFRLQDNGIGIEPQYHQQIFGMFRKLHSRAAYPGSGIGLSICKKIVEQPGGKIWVESELNVGSIFHFTLTDLKK